MWRVQVGTGFLLQPLLQSSDLQAKRHCFDFHSGFERGKEAGQYKGTAPSSQAALFLQEGFSGQMSLIYLCHPGTPCWPIPPPLSCQLLTLTLNHESDQETDPGLRRKTMENRQEVAWGFQTASGSRSQGRDSPSRQAAGAAREASLAAERCAS